MCNWCGRYLAPSKSTVFVVVDDVSDERVAGVADPVELVRGAVGEGQSDGGRASKHGEDRSHLTIGQVEWQVIVRLRRILKLSSRSRFPSWTD